MDLKAVENLAYELLQKHNLPLFKVKFNNSTHTAGECRKLRMSDLFEPADRHGVIMLSRRYFEVWDEAVCRETILHEIAHALNLTSNKPHGAEWKRIALSIGSNGKRCVSEEELVDFGEDVHKWLMHCPNGHSRTRARRTDTVRSCSRCSKTFDKRFIFKMIPNNAENRAWVESLKNPNAARVAPVQTPVRVAAKSVPSTSVKAPAAKAKPSRAAEFDAGAAFINWD